jgi:2-dehydro-3-deoxyphosphogluconate aldolase / (4S)-4-hydroxy-2-oxoglutarate aldolase
MKTLHDALRQKILPAVTFSSIDEVLPVTEAFLRGGLNTIEITFRTAVAADSIGLIRKNYPDMHVGAGTLLSADQVQEAIEAGAEFGLAPGLNPSVCSYAAENNFPFVPGVMTPSEMELAAEMGFRILKLFPAAQIQGAEFLKALNSTYTQLQLAFIPMGGVSIKNIQDYLQLENVIAVGGSWLAGRELISNKRFGDITRNAKEVLDLINKKQI